MPIRGAALRAKGNITIFCGAGNLTQDAFITCFVQGSQIETSQGALDVARLSVGDLVQTMDHGLQPIRWIGGRNLRARNQPAQLFKASDKNNCYAVT